MKYYFIGIKGAGMSALSLILKDLGYEVSGYDDEKEHTFTEDRLIKKGIKIDLEDVNQLDSDTVVVRSTAIKDEHFLIQRAKQLDLKIYEYNEMLGKIANMFDLITVAGCHGKTTTSALMSHVLENMGGCNYLIGDGSGFASKDNKKFVIEACEYYRHFLVYKPNYAVITNIELDHVDYFKDINDVIDAYTEYGNNAEKMVIVCGDDPYTRFLELNKPIFYYGIAEDNDVVAKNIEYTVDGVSFDVFVEENYYGHFDLPFFGKHMVLNTLAVISICYYERMDAKEVCKYLKTFKGAERRFDEEEINNIVVVDDYAHHPTEIKTIIKAVKQKYPNKKIITVFKPHTFSRTEAFADELVKALSNSDYNYLLDIYPARENQEDYPNITSKMIVDKLENGSLISDNNWEELKKHDDCVVLFLSPKEIKIMNKYKEYLKSLEF